MINPLIKKYSIHLLYALLPIIAVAMCLEFYIQNLDDSYEFKSVYLQQNGAKIETLILGNSHAYYSVDPTLLGANAFTLAQPSQALEYDIELLNAHLENLPNLKEVIFTISIGTLLKSGEEGNSWRDAFYYHKMGVNDALENAPETSKMSLLLGAGLKPVLKTIQYQVTGQSQKLRCLPAGNGTYNSVASEQKLIRTGFNASERHQQEDQRIEKRIAILKSTVSQLLKKNIRVVFISTPVHHYYASNLDSSIVNKVDSTIYSIIKVDTSLVYLNFRKSLTLPDSLFYDADHLNKKGSQVFTQMLATKLKK